MNASNKSETEAREDIKGLLSPEDRLWVDETIGKITTKMAWVSEKSADKIPYKTDENGVHTDKRVGDYRVDDGLQWWTNGFWGGMLWLMFHETGDEKYAAIARKSEEWMDECFNTFHGLHHDVGFMWLPTSVANYRLTGDMDARRRGLHAANLLAGRFNPVGRFIRAWDDVGDEDTRGWAIIDCMFNIPLLYWASEETKDPRYKHIAMMHADTVIDAFIRPDGSSEHIVKFDPEVGGKLDSYRGQGYAKGSAWTRGQTWALYGFMMSYIHTKKPEYLETAKRVARYFMDHIPESGVIPVDFQQPAEPAYEDSTAAAIAACGFIELARYVEEGEKDEYMQAALKLLKVLDKEKCDYSEKQDNIVNMCSGAYFNNEQHISIIYGDYYYMEALFKLKGDDVFFW
ncbi:glycoside hydrolase family 88 protein [Pontiellaceae bacterium B1224]|nr:glycoside hydrolase family 88 protein [Pontiellaceae bacterium B1224]